MELVNGRWSNRFASVESDSDIRITQRTAPGDFDLDFDPFFDDIRLVSGCEDEDNSRFIIWALDRLEEMGKFPRLHLLGTWGQPDARYRCYDGYDGTFSHGSTRAEACFNALLAALEAETQKGPSG